MIKKKTYLTVFLALLAGCVILIGCAGEGAGSVSKSVDNSMETEEKKSGTFPGLDAETERRIIQTRYDYLVSIHPQQGIRVWIEQYYGTYNGVVAVKMGDNQTNYAAAVKKDVVAGILFVYPQHHSIIAWKDGSFYGLQKACDLGLLTQDDIQAIRDLHGDPFPDLDAETERRITQDYYDNYLSNHPPHLPQPGRNDFWIEEYYGTYNDVVAVTMDGDRVTELQIATEVVAGILFVYPAPYYIWAWKDGSLYRLQKAYELNLLTQEEIQIINDLHRAEHGFFYELNDMEGRS